MFKSNKKTNMCYNFFVVNEMIKINSIEYSTNNKITYGHFSTTMDNIKQEGTSPNVYINCSKSSIMIESIYDISIINTMEYGAKMDITKYISDIIYTDEKGWISLISGKISCELERIDAKTFRIFLSCYEEELDEKFDIYVDEVLNI